MSRRVPLGDYQTAIQARLTQLFPNIPVVKTYNVNSANDKVFIRWNIRNTENEVFTGSNKDVGIALPVVSISIYRSNVPVSATVPDAAELWDTLADFFSGYQGYINPNNTGPWASKCRIDMLLLRNADIDSFSSIDGDISMEIGAYA